jgi:hypothetical protein
MAQTNPWDHSMDLDERDGAHHATILTPEEARQGVVSGRVSLILVVSLMLAVIAGAIVFAVLV